MSGKRWLNCWCIPTDTLPVRLFLIALAGLLVGYMFMGRGFAHLGRPPVYIGEIVLFLGLLATAFALVRLRLRPSFSRVVWLLLVFMVLGLVRTVPYLGLYGVDALRDAVLWGYGIFALMVYALSDRPLVKGAMRLYGWIVPVFAVWLPISFNIFVILSAGIQADERGSNIPIIFFKSGDMAVHVVGALAFLVVVSGPVRSVRTLSWRAAITVPLLWTAFVGGATNRGALVTVAAGVAAIGVMGFLVRRSRNWVPLLIAPAVLALIFVASGVLSRIDPVAPAPAVTPVADAVSSGPRAPSPSGQGQTARLTECETVGGPDESSLIANASFERGDAYAGTIDGWRTGSGLYHIVPGGGLRDERHASVQNIGGPSTATLTSCRFPFRGGNDISVSVWVKAMAGAPVIGVFVNWYDGSGTRISSVRVSSLSTGGITTWQETAGALKAPADTVQAEILMREEAGAATLGIDELTVTVEASRSLVTNSGFELGATTNTLLMGWELVSGSAASVQSGAYRGEKFASLQGGDDAYTAAIASSRFPVRADDDVSVSVRVKAIVGSPSAVVFVNWYDASGDEISRVSLSWLATEGASSWQESTGAVTAPANATHAQVIVWEAAGGNATMGIDEVIVRAGDLIEPPPVPEGRPATIDQIIENLTSIFSDVEDEALEGTKRFRLRWWGAIVNYTVFGEYFWTGKGFGINLADADGFQANEDRSLRAPHNSHMTALARMGVPGFVLWVVLQVAFIVGLLRSVLAHRRAGDMTLAGVGAWVVAYWVAMMVNTSFDPYLEGPQGGIWFWSLFGLGLVVMSLSHKRREA